MPSSGFPTNVTGVTVQTATNGALSGDGSSGNKLAVGVDGVTINVNGSNQLEVISGAEAPVNATYLTATDQTGTLANSRQLLAGTNVTFDDTTPGERTVNAAGGGSLPLQVAADGDPVVNNASSVTQYSIQQGSSAFGGSSYATVTTDLSDPDANIKFVARPLGAQANDETITYVDPGAGDNAFSLVIDYPTLGPITITVNLATTAGLITTTAQDIIDAFTTADAGAAKAVHTSAVASGGNATGVVAAGSWTLSGGANGVSAKAAGLDVSGSGFGSYAGRKTVVLFDTTDEEAWSLWFGKDNGVGFQPNGSGELPFYAGDGQGGAVHSVSLNRFGINPGSNNGSSLGDSGHRWSTAFLGEPNGIALDASGALVTTSAGVAASLTTDLGVPNADLTWTETAVGQAGNAIQVQYTYSGDPGDSLNADYNAPLLTIALATDGGAVITTTAQDIIDLGSYDGAPVAVAIAPANDGSGIVIAMSAQNLSGGLAALNVTGPSWLDNGAITTDGSGNTVFDGTVTATDFIMSGSSLKTDTTDAHTGLIQAYDVDGAAYKTFATLTNGNTPSLALSAPAGTVLSGDFTSLAIAGTALGSLFAPISVVAPLKGTTGSIGGSLLATIGATVTGTATVTGAVVGSPVIVSASDGTAPNALVVLSASVTSTNTVTVQLSALAAVTPSSKSYNVTVFN